MDYKFGEEIDVIVDREGIAADAGVGHLSDDTMVIVVGAADRVGQMVHATIIGSQATPCGGSLLANMSA